MSSMGFGKWLLKKCHKMSKRSFDEKFRHLQITVPSTMDRGVRHLEQLSRMKATEIEHYILYFAVPIFDSIIDSKHLKTLVALRDFVNTTHTTTNISVIEEKADVLHDRLSDLRGCDKVTMKMHTLKHIHEFISVHGNPLYWTAKGYENYLSMVRAHTQQFTNVTSDIIYRLHSRHILSYAESVLVKHNSIAPSSIFELKHPKYSQDWMVVGNFCRLLDSPTRDTRFNENEISILLGNLCKDHIGTNLDDWSQNVEYHEVVVVNGCRMESVRHDRVRDDKCDCFIERRDGPLTYVSEIEVFVNVFNKKRKEKILFAVCSNFELLENVTATGMVISHYETEDCLKLVIMSEIVMPIVCVGSCDQSSVIKLRRGMTHEGAYRIWPSINPQVIIH